MDPKFAVGRPKLISRTGDGIDKFHLWSEPTQKLTKPRPLYCQKGCNCIVSIYMNNIAHHNLICNFLEFCLKLWYNHSWTDNIWLDMNEHYDQTRLVGPIRG